MKNLFARALAVTTVATASMVVAPTSATAETSYSIPDFIPDDCGARLMTAGADGQKGQIILGYGTGIRHLEQDVRYPFDPQNVVPYGAAGGPTGGHSSFWVTAPDGKLHDMTFSWALDSAGKETSTLTDDSVVGTGWQGTEDLSLGYASGSGYLYRITDDGHLWRYTMSAGQLTDKTLVFSGGSGILSLEAGRVITWKGSKAQILLTTTEDGRLREYIVPVDSPSDYTGKTLKKSSWNYYSTISTGQCGANGRVIMGRNDSGNVIGVWYDKDVNDFSGADIQSGYTNLPALPESTKTF